MELLLATGNRHKVSELAAMLSGSGWTVKSLADYADYQAPPEDGETFLANAVGKAVAAAQHSGLLTVADDSGLEVDFLDGAPGVYSARFAGAAQDDAANNAKLLELLREAPPEQRTARFTCVVVVASPDGQFFYKEGHCPGQIAAKPSGSGGFGYDPLFYLPQYGCTMAELAPEEKNRISHRGRAMAQIVPLLAKIAQATPPTKEEDQ